MNLERKRGDFFFKPKNIQLGDMVIWRESEEEEEGELVFTSHVRLNSIRVRRVSMLAPFAAAFAELPTRIKEENAEM